MGTISKRGISQYQAKIRRRGQSVSKTFSTRRKAEAWAARVEGEMDGGVWIDSRPSERTTLADVLARYEREVLPSKKSQQQVRSQIKNISAQSFATLPLTSITSTMIAEYRDQRLAGGAGNQTVKHDLSLISRVINHAWMEWGLVLPRGNPCACVKKPSLPHGRDRRLSPTEEKKLLAAAREYGGEIESIIILAVETAMRRGEIAAIRENDINLKTKTISIRETKTDTPRRVPLTRRAEKTIRQLLKANKEKNDKDKDKESDNDKLIGLSPDSITQAFNRICARAGISDLRYHDLRHESASRLAEKGLSVLELASVTGHRTIQMLARYTHPRAEDIAAKLR